MKNKTIARAEAILATERKKRAKIILRRCSAGEPIAEVARSLQISRQRASVIYASELAKAAK